MSASAAGWVLCILSVVSARLRFRPNWGETIGVMRPGMAGRLPRCTRRDAPPGLDLVCAYLQPYVET